MSPEIESQVCSAFGALLLAAITVLVAVMPLTEYFLHLDEFLHGGQDFELSLLCLLAFLCLILVMFQKGKKDLQRVFVLRLWLAHIFCAAYAERMPDARRGLIGPLHAVPLPSAALGKYNLPTQI